jgi:outer membrane protein TolC
LVRNVGVLPVAFAPGQTDARAQLLPTLAFDPTGRYNSQADLEGNHLTWAVPLALSLPLYDGGLRQLAALRVATAAGAFDPGDAR